MGVAAGPVVVFAAGQVAASAAVPVVAFALAVLPVEVCCRVVDY